MSRILHSFEQPLTEVRTYAFIITLLVNTAKTQGVPLPSLAELRDPKSLCRFAARLGESLRLRGDTVSYRVRDTEHTTNRFVFIEAKVPAGPAPRSDDHSCVRCGGEGRLVQFTHVDKGTCYRCGGTGRDPSPQYAAWKNAELRACRERGEQLEREATAPVLDRLAHAWSDQPVLC